ncbi:hypothetical protein MC7420_4749 [Coleofasciculus chthonoplastes PCC 7420]|uniref:eCIS core domain-containing protein n=1 Tax=Coleofasciculus chthonoplastes PCC 7420 TaxID=118168 RepID=B4VNX9_9CYAN|nr:hypothetical protein MC7420_4749 [Coleofasciculus chthonoplastes PCC 7420]
MQRQIDPRVQMRQMIQRAHQIDGNQASGDLESRLNASKGGGSPLSENVRGFMEPRFGADFSGVRVHTGGEAVQMNQELGAQAFTHGSDVYFGEGKEPGNNGLTAHELTHVVQQTGAVQLKSPGRQLSSSLSGNFISESMIQCDFWESLGRGWNMYWRLNDEGASLARTLMEWRMTGFGMTYEPVVQWSTFMTDRPEIQRAMAKKFKQLAVGFAATGGSGTFNDSVTGVKLNELESMRLTLHGCHRIEMSGNYEVSDEGGNKIVRFTNVHFIWIDRADLHPGTGTELSSGEVVDDREFTGAGWDYDIRIHFFMPRTSTWRVSGRTARHERGWPPVTGAPAAGFRG